jgi:predicted transcriptional regulator
MTVVHSTRKASIDEIASEMDRRGAVIEKLEAERNLYKGKYRALLKLISKTRAKLVHVTDNIEDEGDRRYFGSSNDADDLQDLYDEMMSWVWDATDETNRMKSDPYADIRKQRARAEKAEAATDQLADKIEDLIAEFGDDPRAALECVSEHLSLRRSPHPHSSNS